MSRTLTVLSVATLMAAMMVTSAMPAFAVKGGNGGGATVSEPNCRVAGKSVSGHRVVTPSGNANLNCHYHKPNGE